MCKYTTVFVHIHAFMQLGYIHVHPMGFYK